MGLVERIRVRGEGVGEHAEEHWHENAIVHVCMHVRVSITLLSASMGRRRLLNIMNEIYS